jgi:EAL domain-containing protein (putative c-di-GMP-specific phosphodiesterase class I)
MDRDAPEILFQPQFAAHNGHMIGAEALARCRYPQLDRVGPAALAAATEWPAPLRLSLNVTAADLAEAGFVGSVVAMTAEARFPPERLTIEITEQALIADLYLVADRLRRLADHGIRVALDDFGAGFCNFSYLKRLPLHCLKLDRSMIEGIDEDSRDLAVLRGIVAMATALGLEVIAEGVETERQRAAVASEGCTAWQGFLGAAPMTAAELARMAR